MSKRDGAGKMNAFGAGETDLESVADAIYGKSEMGIDTGRIVARPTSIDKIWADRRQPRRAIPASIGMHWNGSPEDVADLLSQWYAVSTRAAGVSINLVELLSGRGEGIELEGKPAIFVEYMELVRLAADINLNGLTNPITLLETGQGVYRIETGERRWLSFHLLHNTLGDHDKIPASKSEAGLDYVWRQASENTARRQLNAIGMARQLALLIMAARQGEGEAYREYEDIVRPGGCDRAYYAQVADGNKHRIPKGMAERIEATMGLSNTQLSRYRTLLSLTDDDVVNDAIWVKADVEEWAERAIREIDTLPMGKVRQLINRDNWTLDDLRAAAAAERPAPPPPPPPSYSPPPTGAYEQAPDPADWPPGLYVRTPAGHRGTVVSVSGNYIIVDTANGRSKYLPHSITPAADQVFPPEQKAPPPEPDYTFMFEIGEAVMPPSGQVGEITGMQGSRYTVEIEGLPSQHEGETLVSLGMSYKEYLADAMEDDFDDFEEHPVEQGNRVYHDLPGQRSAPDKSHYEAPSPVDNRPVLDRVRDKEAFSIIDGLMITFYHSGQPRAAEALKELKAMRRNEAQELASEGRLTDVFGSYYETVALALNHVLETWLGDLLTRIEKEAGNDV